jgi:hypothetical protein
MPAQASSLTAPRRVSSQLVMMVYGYAIGMRLIELREVLFVEDVDLLFAREIRGVSQDRPSFSPLCPGQ